MSSVAFAVCLASSFNTRRRGKNQWHGNGNGHGLGSARKPEGGAAVLDAALDPTKTLEGLKGVVDGRTTVFIADRDQRLVYMNRKASETLAKFEPALEKMFGGSEDALIGRDIADIHGHRAKHIAAMLGDPSKLPHRAKIRVGEMIMDLTANAIFDESGEFVGVVANWEEISEKRRLTPSRIVVRRPQIDIHLPAPFRLPEAIDAIDTIIRLY